MRECPAVARAEIERLQAKGVNLTLDQLTWLINLGQKVETPAGRSNPFLSGVPAVAGCSLIWPETVQAACWLDAVSGWFSDDAAIYMIAFALANGRRAGAFADLYDMQSARSAVDLFRRSCNATVSELRAAVNAVSDTDTPDRPADGPAESMRMLALEMQALTKLSSAEIAVETIADVLALARITAKYAGADVAETDATREPLRNLLLAAREIEEQWATN